MPSDISIELIVGQVTPIEITINYAQDTVGVELTNPATQQIEISLATIGPQGPPGPPASFDGLSKITVGAVEPVDPDPGDLWVDVS
jgi:hypothetical protein